MPGLGVFYHLFDPEPASTHCQLLSGELHDKLVDLRMSSETKEGECGKMLAYLRTVHKHAILCPRSTISEVDTHYAGELSAANLYYKTYFNAADLSKGDGESIQNMISARVQEDHSAFKNGLSWSQWIARVVTQKPRKFG
jgi:hypothetical protein